MLEILENRSCEIWQVLCGFKAAIEIGPIKKGEGRDQFMLEENMFIWGSTIGNINILDIHKVKVIR